MRGAGRHQGLHDMGKQKSIDKDAADSEVPVEGTPAAGRVWWSYLGRTYRRARDGGYLWAPGDPDHPLRQVRTGDLVVHEYLRQIVSVSQVLSEPSLLPMGVSGEAVGGGEWRVRAQYVDVKMPVPFEDLQDELRRVEPPDGPMHAEIGSGKPGDLYPFNRAGLNVVLRATETELP